MDEVIAFDKNFHERLEEYLDVLGNRGLKISQIKHVWSLYLEMTIDPGHWQAIWKICRLTCESLNVSFPTFVLVYVDGIDFKDHTAFVRTLAVQDDITLPKKHIVPLIHLYPTKDQAEASVLNLQCTASALDLLRFFYSNIVQPWDFENDSNKLDWVNEHLEPRLQLYYDMKNEVIARPIAEYIRGLFIEARRLQSRKEQILGLEADTEDPEQRVQELGKLQIRLMRIKGEIQILENPLLKKIFIKQKEQELFPNKSREEPTNWVVSEKSNADDYIDFLQEIKNKFPNEPIMFSHSLLSTLDCLKSTDRIILNKSKYRLEGVGRIVRGGQIRGIYDLNFTEIVSDSNNLALDFSGDITLKNIFLNSEKSEVAILVRSGKVTLKNCKLMGQQQGVIVSNDAQLIIDNCEIIGFSTGIVGNIGGRIDLNQTRVQCTDVGIVLYNNCVLQASETTFTNCREYGIYVETGELIDKNQNETFDSLNQLSNVIVENIKGENNGKGDVSINSVTNALSMKDLVAELSSDEFGCDSDENE